MKRGRKFGHEVSKETRKKISVAHLGKHYGGGMSGKKHSQKTKEKISKSAIKKNFSEIGKIAKHYRISRMFGTPQKCEYCGTEEALKYEWANKNHLYSEKREDWMRLCTSCHRRYDIKYNFNKQFDIIK